MNTHSNVVPPMPELAPPDASWSTKLRQAARLIEWEADYGPGYSAIDQPDLYSETQRADSALRLGNRLNAHVAR